MNDEFDYEAIKLKADRTLRKKINRAYTEYYALGETLNEIKKIIDKEK